MQMPKSVRYFNWLKDREMRCDVLDETGAMRFVSIVKCTGDAKADFKYAYSNARRRCRAFR